MSFSMLKIHKFFLLNKAERRIFISALRLLAYYRVSLKVCPLKSIFLEVRRECRDEIAGVNQIGITIGRIGQLIGTASRCIPFTTCFSRALAGLVVYRANGFPVKLHIGVSRDQNDGLAAHAWLTCAGEVVLCHLPDISKFKEISLEKLEMFQ